ncbi:MAG: DUF2125 domain-containing protein [Hyphomicrobiales bacterium]|nr:DUF2125 domain-containing protein [Hyphomicrobiales bacterium]
MLRKLTLLVGVLLVAAAVWTYFWFDIAGRAEAELELQLARAADEGMVVECAERSFGGFPFRLELDCTKPHFDLDGNGGTYAMGERLRVVSMVWAPFKIVAVLDGPAVARTPETVEPVRAEWSSARASAEFSSESLDRLSVEFADLRLGPGSTAAAQIIPNITMKLFEAHGRPVPDDPTGTDLDFAGRAVDLDIIAADGHTVPLMSLDLDTTIRKALPVLLSPAQTAEKLKSWQVAGGRLEIHRFRGALGDTALADGSGTLATDATGRLEGRIEARMAGIERLLAPAGGAIAQLGPMILGPETELEGRRARSVVVKFKEGRVQIGPLGIGDLPPLY